MLKRLSLAAALAAGLFSHAHSAGLTSRGATTVGTCYASGASGMLVPCALQGGAWQRLTMPGDDASFNSVTSTGAVSGLTIAGDASGAKVIAPNATRALMLSVMAGSQANLLAHGPSGAAVDQTCTTNVSAALQHALNAPGQSVFVPPGCYGFSASVTAPSGKSSIVALPGTVTFKALPGNTSNALFIYAPPSVTGLDISGVALDGNMANVGVDTVGVQTFGSTGVVFDKSIFTNNRGPLVAFSKSNRSGIKNSYFTNVGQWWKSGGPSQVNVVVSFNTGDTATTGGDGNFFTENKADTIGGDWFDAEWQTNGFRVTGNTGVSDNLGWVNQLTGAGTAGFYVFAGGGNMTISNNNLFGFTGNGLDFNCINGLTSTGNVSNNNGGAGISVSSSSTPLNCAMSNFTITGNVTLNNYQAASPLYAAKYPVLPAPVGGISTVNQGGAGDTGAIMNGVIDGNLSTDTQTTKTQLYGYFQSAQVSLSNVKVTDTNNFEGNKTAASNVAINGRGTGSNAFVCSPAFSSTAAGNFGSMACGYQAQAPGVGSIAWGTNVLAQGTYGKAEGINATDRGRYGMSCRGNGNFAAQGDSQSCGVVLRGSGSSTAPIRLTANGAAAGAANCINLPDNTNASLALNVHVRDVTAPSKSYSWSVPVAILLRGVGASTTALTLGTPAVLATNSFAPTVSATADTTNGCLNLSVTPPSGNTDTIRASAYIGDLEVQ